MSRCNCPTCNDYRDFRPKRVRIAHNINGRRIEFDMTCRVCDGCGDEAYLANRIEEDDILAVARALDFAVQGLEARENWRFDQYDKRQREREENDE